MAKRQKTKVFSFQGFDNAHYKTTAAYTRAVNALFNKATEDVANMAVSLDVDTEKPFSFDDYPKARARLQTTINRLAKKMQAVIELGSRKQWLFACQKNDEFIASIFDTTKLTKGQLKKYQDRNLDALQSFQQRKVGGMNLSERVWKYAEQYKAQIEVGLDVGLGEGRSAQQLSRDLRQNLQDPNRLFRRVRDKRGNLHLSKTAKAFHPGTGVYRSSYKNAMRLTRSEVNMAYRESDWLRWQNLDFVIGFEVRRSNHEPKCECKLCERLVGRYPKWFKFKGWHPQCMCYCVPILEDFYSKERSDDRVARMRAALRGEEAKKYVSKNLIKDLPDNFKEWVSENEEKQANWSSTPYFIKDNFVDGDLTKGLKYVQKLKPLTLLEKAAIRHEKRTPEQVQDIQKRWEERKQKHALIKQEAQGILDNAKDYNEVDFSALQNAIDSGDIGKMQSISREVAKAISEMRKQEQALSNLIPDVHEWHKQFTISELQGVYKAIEDKLASWEGLTLEKQAEKLKFEWDDFLGGNMKNVQLKYKTWQVSQAAYKRKYEQVLDSIDWQNIDNVLQEALTFKTKSKPYLDLIDELQVSISAGDKTKAQSIVADMQAKRAALKRAADARAVKRYGKSADGLYAGGNPFEAGELAKLKDYETRIIDGIMSSRGADHNLIAQYHDYVLQLSEKYYPKQASLFTEEERNAMKAIADKYLARPKTNPHWIWGTDLGGVYSGIDSKVNAYLPKLAGLTREELSIVQRFTNGSTFSNCYNLRNESEYWRNKFKDKLSGLSRAEIKEQYEIIEEWSQGANYTLDRMVRYNGITFRGLDSGGGPELRKTLSQAFKKNKPWVNNASCSTSMKHLVAESFDGDTILIIHNKTGAYIHAISDYRSEYEIMTLRGTKYKVLAPPKRIGSRYYVELEEII